MEDKIKLIYNKLIYELLDLKNIEEEISNSGIKSKEIVNNENYDLASKYFFLKNDIYLGHLDSNELNFLERTIYSINFSNILISEELSKFLLEKISKILLPNTNEKYLSYYGTGNSFLAPSDAIVFAFHYLKYLDSDEELMENQEDILCDKLNYIQNVIAPSKNMKVAILVFDELVNEKNKNY